MTATAQPAQPTGLNVTIGMQQVGMELVLVLTMTDGALSTQARTSIEGARLMRDALNTALDAASTTILKAPGPLVKDN